MVLNSMDLNARASERSPMPMRPSLVRFGLLAAALAVGGSACQAPPEPWPQSVERAPPLPYREPIAVATRKSPPPERIAPIIDRGTGSFVQRSQGPVTPAIARNAAGEVTLNVVDADLREVVRMVLQDALGVNYVIDPAVQGHGHRADQRAGAGRGVWRRSSMRSRGSTAPRWCARRPLQGRAARHGAVQRRAAGPPTAARGGHARVRHPRGPAAVRYGGRAGELLAPFAPPGGALQVDLTRNVLLLAGRPPNWMR